MSVTGTMLLSFPEKQSITVSADDTVSIVDDISKDSSEDTTDKGYVLSSEVSNSWRLKNDPEYKKYLEGKSAFSVSSRAFGVTTPTVPSKMKSYKKYNVVDVSEFQAWHDPIDWEALKKQGITGAIIRVGYRGYGDSGTIVKDQYFDQNIKGALDAGLNVGVYFYTQAINAAEAKTEADYVAKWISGYYITLPVYFDIEYVDYDVGRLDAANLSKAQKTALCTAFCDRIQSKNYYAGVYASKYYFYDELNYTELQSKYDIWLAYYSTSTDYTGSFDAWQYSSNGKVTGIYDYVDLDLWFATTPYKISDIKVTRSGTDMTLSWRRPKGAYAFYIEKYDADTKAYKQLATIKSCSYKLKNVSSSDQYRVVPYKRMGSTVFSGKAYEIEGHGSLAPSSPVVNTKSINKNSIEVRFDKSNVTGYRLYIADNKNYTDSKYIQGSSNILKFGSLSANKTYYFKAYTYNTSNGKVYWSTPITFTASTKTVAAVGISEKSSACGSVTANFTKKSVTGYRLYVSDNKDYKNAKYVQGTGTSQTVSGLKPSTAYYFKAYNYIVDDNTVYWSDPITFTYSTTAMPTVSVSKKTVYPNEISVTFNKQSVSGYRLYISKNKDMTGSTYVQGSSNVQSISDLRPDTTYYFKAYMYQISNGTAYWSKPITFSQKTVDLESPSLNTLLTTSSTTSINFKLNPVPRAEGYRIWMYDSASLTNGRMLDGGSAITFSGLTPNKTYFVRAYAYITVDGEKYFSDPTEFSYKTLPANTLQKVSGFEVSSVSKNSVKLTWNKVSGAQGYIVYKYDASKKNYVRVKKTSTNTNSYTVSGLSEGTSYTFAIKAYKTVNGKEIVSESFPTAKAVTKLSAVSGFKVSSVSKNSVKLTWNKVSGAQGYIVYKYDTSKKNYVRVTKTSNNVNSYTVSGLSEGTSYTFAIKAYKTVDGKEIVSESFPTAKAVTKLSAVSGFKVSSVSKNSVKLTWNKVSGAQGYIVYKYDASKKNYVRVAKTSTNVNSYTVSRLSEGTSYTFAIKAYKTVDGKEIVSESFPTAKAVTKLSAVSGLRVSSVSKNSVKITWNKLSGAQGYIVYKYDASKKTYVRVKKTTNNTTSYTITGLKSNTSYTVTVKAYKTVDGKEIVSESFTPLNTKTSK